MKQITQSILQLPKTNFDIRFIIWFC